MKRFLKRHKDRIVGILSGLDRIVFNAAPGFLRYGQAVEKFLVVNHIRFADYAKWFEAITGQLREHARVVAQREGRPLVHVSSPSASKEDLVRHIMERDGIQQGLICVLTCVEIGYTYRCRAKAKQGKPGLVSEPVPCQHLYFYYRDRDFGVMHLRIQTWVPFRIQVCLNGHDWLARQLDGAAIGYEKSDNCFVQIDDVARAQEIFDHLLALNWQQLLSAWASRVFPWMAPDSPHNFGRYRWCVRQSECATDVMFRSAADLAGLYPRLIHHATTQLQSSDVLHFVGRHNRRGDIHSRTRKIFEGLCVRHTVEENSVKMYNKAPNLLRVETTINQPKRFVVWRPVTRHGEARMGWAAMRKGVMDLRRRAPASRAANQRYLNALAVVGESCPSHRVLDPVSQPVVVEDRRYRALHPISREDGERLAVLQQGHFTIRGFRNKDLAPIWLDSKDLTPRQLSARVSRYLRLLKAHGLIYRLRASHRYQLTIQGRQVIRTALVLRNADADKLKEAA